jgi:beta-xylosidase
MPVQTSKTVPPPTRIDNFTGATLSHEWEWNHNPDNSKWSLGPAGLILQTASVTDDLFAARNTLTHRILGPKSVATFVLDIDGMRDGDRAGAAVFRDRTAYVGVHKTNGTATLVAFNGLELSGSWATQSKGALAAIGPAVGDSKVVWLRIVADITPAFGQKTQRQATFAYSPDGTEWKTLGPAFNLINDWRYFTGFRYAVFNFATKALGGAVTLKSFSMELVY